MKTILIMALVFTLTITASAQQRVALQNNGVTTIFEGTNPFESAYTAAVNGDTIYLPGGNIPYPATINKNLKIYGTGHYPDLTLATNKTILTGSISIGEDADNLLLEGIDLTGTITFLTNNKVDGVVINRCRLGNIYYAGTAATPCENNIIRECVIVGSITLTNATSCLVTNCIINGKIENANNIGISNNILLYNQNNYGGYATYATFNNVDNCMISNNVIFRVWGTGYLYNLSDLNTFSHNIFGNTPSTGTNTFVDNYYEIDLSTFLVLQSGLVFDYTHNYNLQAPDSYTGTDGTQVGIYGGMYPYKVGAVPSNPHIITKSISTETNADGEISINISVEAQNN